MSFENIFVVGKQNIKINYSYDKYDDLAKFIIKNYLKNYRFSFEQLIDKLATDAIEYFGHDQAQYEQALILRKLHKYLNEPIIQIKDDNLFTYDHKPTNNISDLDELFSELSVKQSEDSFIVCKCCNPPEYLKLNKNNEHYCVNTGQVHYLFSCI